MLLQLQAKQRIACQYGRGAGRGAISPGRCAWVHVWRGHGSGAGTTQGVAEKGRAQRRKSTVIFASLFRGDFKILLCHPLQTSYKDLVIYDLVNYDLVNYDSAMIP